jgi:hypothetical protein
LPEANPSDIDIYIFDSSSIIDIFRHYDPATFQSLWKDIDKLLSDDRFISHMEVHGECSKGGTNPDVKWLKQHRGIFYDHTTKQAKIIRDIQRQYKGRYQKVLIGAEKEDYHADPWLMALATELQAMPADRQRRIGVARKNKRYFIVTEDGALLTFATNELKFNCITKNELFKKENWHY